jgi:sodium-dependent dicarboxylate transporter 2/3/5
MTGAASDRELPHTGMPSGPEPPAAAYGLRQWAGWVLGPGVLLATLLTAPPAGLGVEGWHTAGVAVLMATFWICESLPIPATALMPLVLLPALKLANIQEAAAPFATPVVFLFLGGFLIALGMQRWHLHRRIALHILGVMGPQPRRIVAGFLLASALLSMWVSNSATTLMMLPIALSVLALQAGAPERGAGDFGAALVLAVAYGATTGGMATLIGTPPNALLAAYVSKVYGHTLGFAQWMLLGVPVMLVALPAVYLVLTRWSFRLGRQELPGLAALLEREMRRLGGWSRGEKIVLAVFVITAAGWILQPLLARRLPLITDTTIAIAGALLLFMAPVNLRRGEFALGWEDMRKLPWDVLILFGGGLSLAGQMERHGLSRYLGELCHGLQGLPVVVVLVVVCLGILFLTELTSNTATAATFLPIVAAVAVSLGQPPLLFLIPTALAANCSYMMPVGTPPNAIAFGSGLVHLPQMARAGVWINLLLVPVIVGLVLLLAPLVFGRQM